ncbi:MAG: L,D-transpeptidase family protein [Anaerolineae bacterium]
MIDAKALLQQGIARAKSGRRASARRILQQAVEQDPANEAAWLWLAGTATSPEEAAQALDRVQQLNPASPYLARARQWVSESLQPASPAEAEAPAGKIPQPQPQPRQKTGYRLWERLLVAWIAATLVTLLGIAAIGLTIPPESARRFLPGDAKAAIPLGPTPTDTPAEAVARLQPALESARLAGDRPAQMHILEQMRALDPANPQVVARLQQVYFEQGVLQRNAGDLAGAQISFEQAIALGPPSEAVERELELVKLFQTGIGWHRQGRWQQAIDALQPVYDRDLTYPNIDELLYSAYYNLGLARLAADELAEALASFQAAAAVIPTAPEAPQKLAEVKLLLQPPTPAPDPAPQPAAGDKRVVVDISEQRTYAYEGDELVFDFIVSTGEPGRDTALGEFEIQNKIPVAYASTWNLDMPYWLGIYWAGPLQNGFHALPTVRHTGQKLWDGYLGQRVSYGCIILGDEDARKLYDWVDVGTPVSIVP